MTQISFPLLYLLKVQFVFVGGFSTTRIEVDGVAIQESGIFMREKGGLLAKGHRYLLL